MISNDRKKENNAKKFAVDLFVELHSNDKAIFVIILFDLSAMVTRRVPPQIILHCDRLMLVAAAQSFPHFFCDGYSFYSLSHSLLFHFATGFASFSTKKKHNKFFSVVDDDKGKSFNSFILFDGAKYKISAKPLYQS